MRPRQAPDPALQMARNGAIASKAAGAIDRAGGRGASVEGIDPGILPGAAKRVVDGTPPAMASASHHADGLATRMPGERV